MKSSIVFSNFLEIVHKRVKIKIREIVLWEIVLIHWFQWILALSESLGRKRQNPKDVLSEKSMSVGLESPRELRIEALKWMGITRSCMAIDALWSKKYLSLVLPRCRL